MKDRVTDKSEIGNVESINDKLFATFDPDEEKLWLVGGSYSLSGGASGTNGQWDAGIDGDYTWG